MDYAKGDSSVVSHPANSNLDIDSNGMTGRLNTRRHLLEADRLLFIQSQEKVRTQWVNIEKLQKVREELTKNLHATKSKLHSTNDISDTQQLQALLKRQNDLDKEMEQEKAELVQQVTSCPSNVLHASVPNSAVPTVSSAPTNRDQSKSFMDYAKGDSSVVSQSANSNLDSDSNGTGMAVGLNTLEAERMSFMRSQEKVRTQWVKIEKLQKEREELTKSLHVVKSKLQLQALLTHLDDLHKEIELERAELARQIVYVDKFPEKALEEMQNIQGQLKSGTSMLWCSVRARWLVYP